MEVANNQTGVQQILGRAARTVKVISCFKAKKDKHSKAANRLEVFVFFGGFFNSQYFRFFKDNLCEQKCNYNCNWTKYKLSLKKKVLICYFIVRARDAKLCTVVPHLPRSNSV